MLVLFFFQAEVLSDLFLFWKTVLSDSLNLRTVCTYMRACHPSSTNPGGRSTNHGPIFSSLVGPKASKWGTTCLAFWEDDSLAHDHWSNNPLFNQKEKKMQTLMQPVSWVWCKPDSRKVAGWSFHGWWGWQDAGAAPTPLGMVGMLGECTSIRIAWVSLSSNQIP